MIDVESHPQLEVGMVGHESMLGAELILGLSKTPWRAVVQEALRRLEPGGALHIVEHTLAAICEIFPIYRRMRMLRSWGGIVDVTPDRSPILGKTPVKGLYVNCGWGTGGFKATPGAGDLLAYTMAKDEPHWINAPYNLDRFRNGRLIDEAAAAAVAH